MSVMQAEVRARVTVAGEGDGAKVVDDTDKALGRLEKGAKRTTAEVSELDKKAVGLTSGLGQGAKAVGAFGESFAGGLGKIMGVVGAIGLAGGLVAGLIDAVGDKSFARWTEQAKELEQTYKSVADQLRDIDVMLGRAPEKTKTQVAAEAAFASWEDLNQKIQDGEAAILQLQKERGFVTGQSVLHEKVRADFTGKIKIVEDELRILAQQREAIESRHLELRKAQSAEIFKQVGLSALANAEALKAANALDGVMGKLRSGELAKLGQQALGGQAPGGGGGGGPSLAQQRRDEMVELNRQGVAALRELEREQHEERLKLDGERLQAWADKRGKLERERLSEGMLGDAKSEGGLTAGIRDATSVFASAVPQINEFAGALGMVASEMDRVSAANDNLVEVLAKYRAGEADSTEVAKARTEATKTVTSAIVGSVGAVAKAGAAQIKDERARAGVLAIIETGLGFATLFTNPGESAGHFTAAAILGSVALTAGAAGTNKGGARASASTTRVAVANDDFARRSQAPIVNNIYGGWYGSSTPQESMAGLAGRQRGLDGTGFEGGAWAA